MEMQNREEGMCFAGSILGHRKSIQSYKYAIADIAGKYAYADGECFLVLIFDFVLSLFISPEK